MNKLKQIFLLFSGLFMFANANAQTEVTFYVSSADTSMGTITVALTDTLTPVTVDSFIERVAGKFYDGVLFHRVKEGFMIQGGDPTGTGTGGPGYTIPDEFHPSLKNVPGALAMANTGVANSGGCQFFINLVSNTHLNNKHTVFGMTLSGLDVADSIAHAPKDATTWRPTTDIVMDSVRITKYFSYPLSVTNAGKSMSISLYPNPNNGVFDIALPADITTKVEVLNMRGQLIYINDAKGKATIDIHDRPAGLYLVRMSNAQGVAEQKVLVR